MKKMQVGYSKEHMTQQKGEITITETLKEKAHAEKDSKQDKRKKSKKK